MKTARVFTKSIAVGNRWRSTFDIRLEQVIGDYLVTVDRLSAIRRNYFSDPYVFIDKCCGEHVRTNSGHTRWAWLRSTPQLTVYC